MYVLLSQDFISVLGDKITVTREFVHDKEKKIVVITEGESRLVLTEQEFREVNKTGQSGILMGLKKKKPA